MKKNIIISLILFTMVNCQGANKNRIGKEAAIRNWSYVGPIDSEDNHDKMLNRILENGIGNDSIFVQDGKNYPIKDASASSDANWIAQLYKNIKEDDYVIGVANILSNEDTEVAIASWFYQTKSKLVYLNGEEIGEQFEQSKVIFRRKIKKGENQLIISMKNSDQFGFGYFMQDEKRVEMTLNTWKIISC